MAVSLRDLLESLAEETAALDAALDQLYDDAWVSTTPAEGWTIVDQIGHLAYFDTAVTTAVSDPERFVAERDAMRARDPDLVEAIAAAHRGRSGPEINEWFHESRSTMVSAFEEADPSMRVPWYGPSMSLASAVTARIMETWAHGQDVFDTLDMCHPTTSALRHVAHIGVRALPNSYITRGLEVPVEPVRVELATADGEVWTWGPEDASERVQGRAEEFCLVVTQRRHVDDTRLTAHGSVASQWLSIAQAFAGSAGPGRRPGQFAPLD